jgi:hypothetical protein
MKQRKTTEKKKSLSWGEIPNGTRVPKSDWSSRKIFQRLLVDFFSKYNENDNPKELMSSINTRENLCKVTKSIILQ